MDETSKDMLAQYDVIFLIETLLSEDWRSEITTSCFRYSGATGKTARKMDISDYDRYDPFLNSTQAREAY
jgi:hypothetical protein